MNRSDLHEKISVFRSIDEISVVEFPCRLQWILLAVCVRGRISALIDLTPRSLEPSSIMVLRPGHLVDSCEQSDDFEGFFIIVHQDRIHELIPSMKLFVPYTLHFMSNPIIPLSGDEMRTQRMLCDLLSEKLADSRRPYVDLSIKALVEVLFYDTLSIYARQADRVAASPSRREELVGGFLDLVEQNFRTERAVSFYASRLCVTPKHLSAVLKEASGKTAGEWIDYRVVLEAKTMLRSSGMTIQEISLALNFANQSFFGKYFKHLTGVSPRDFRAKL